MLAVQSAVQTIGKSGWNAFHNYEYVMVNDILFALRPVLQAEGIHITATIVSYEVSEVDASCMVAVTVTDVDTGEALTFNGVGYAKSAKDDKALYKAQTGAFKYALILGFCLDTDSIDEPEDARNEPKFAGKGKQPATTRTSVNRKTGSSSRTTKNRRDDDDEFDI